jgi:2-methylcitrate dehydratase PrpD
MLEDEAVSRLRGCVDVAEAAEYTQRFPENTGAKIVVVDASGIVHTLASHHALGDPEDPLDEDALSEKFTSNLKDIGVDGSASVQLAETIKDLGDCETLEPFGAALRAVSIQIPFSRMQS